MKNIFFVNVMYIAISVKNFTQQQVRSVLNL